MPYFTAITPDLNLARTEILETLASYGARSRSEMLNAAQIIAFGFSTLDALAEAKAPEISPSMRLRNRGCANNLNRSGQQNEQTLAKRLASDLPNAPEPAAEPLNDVPEAEFEQALQHAQAQIATYRDRRSAARPGLLPTRARAPAEEAENNRLWGSAMMNILSEMGMPVQPAPASPSP
jgi:hypothetical protein